MKPRFMAAGFLLLFGLVHAVGAAQPLPFTAASLDTIKAHYAGKPFILSIWSVDGCTHCIAELTMFGKLAKTHSQLPLVLVATDTAEFIPAVTRTTQRLGLGKAQSWVFDDAIPERLRASVDPSWQGEVPRTYLYDARHRREAIAGVVSEKKITEWLKQHQLFHSSGRIQ